MKTCSGGLLVLFVCAAHAVTTEELDHYNLAEAAVRARGRRSLGATPTGTIKLCSVFADRDGVPCGNTATHLQVDAMVRVMNSMAGGLGFHVRANDHSAPTYYTMTYEYHTYPKGAWEATGKAMSDVLFPTCDIIVGQGHGCSDVEIQAQAQVAHAHRRLYFTLRGPRAVLSDPQDRTKRLSPYMFSTHIRSDFYAYAMLKKFVQRSREIDSNSGGPDDRPVPIAFLNFAHNAFFDGVAVQAEEYARVPENGYEVVYSKNLNGEVCLEEIPTKPGKMWPADEGTANCKPLKSYIEEVASTKPEVMVIVSNGDYAKPVFTALSNMRPRVSKGNVVKDTTALRGLFWVGVPWLSGGMHNCAGLGRHCAHAVGATQISNYEADTFVDRLLHSNNVSADYKHLRENDVFLKAAYAMNVSKAEADAAVIPSIIAQAMQQAFYDRRPDNVATPLRAKNADYERLREVLSTGNEVAQTFYGPVSFDEFGNNNGRDATSFQMSENTGTTRITLPQSIPGAVTLRYYAPSYDEARLQTKAYELDYGSVCDSTAVPMSQCDQSGDAKCLMCEPVKYVEEKPEEIDMTLVIAVSVPVAIVLILVIILTMYYAQKKAAIIKAGQIETVISSLKDITYLQHSAAFLSLEDFTAMGKLKPYETMRDEKKLVYCDNISDYKRLRGEGFKIIFVSHQWTSYTQPDYSDDHYNSMVVAIGKLAKTNGWSEEKTLVWCDYLSIPQANTAQQHEAIKALPAYVAGANVLLVVARQR